MAYRQAVCVQRSERFCKRFTLVELLVVIAIIAILASMLAPVLRTAQQTAMSIKCTATIKNIALGFSMYADENNNAIPVAYDSTLNMSIHNPHWHSFIYPVICPQVGVTDGYSDIVKKSQLVCPSDDGSGGTKLTTYAMNAHAGMMNWWGFTRNIYLRTTLIKKPSMVYLASEKESGTTTGGYSITRSAFSNLLIWSDDDSYRLYRIALRHRQSANFIFFDGHAESLSVSRILTLTPEELGKSITSYYPGMP